jgi:para-aminobenzoate synthetase component 1
VDKDTAIAEMNKFGMHQKPFLFVIDFKMQENIVIPLEEVQPDEIKYEVNGKRNFTDSPAENPPEAFLVKHPVSFETYKKAFDKVMHHLHRGNSYLLNLTFPTPIETDLSLQDIFLRSKAKYKLYIKDRFTVFSPEIFVQIKEGRIASFPMKGTIDAAIPDAEKLILQDEKETAEHNTIVDLIRNDLSMVAKKVRVERFRYIDKIQTNEKTLLQVSSEISGVLENDYSAKIGDIIFRLLPAGSVTGAPKKKTVEVILETETYNRGCYTGVFGIFDKGMLDSCVMIRFIENINDGLVYKSGGGITSSSDALTEYEEMISKVYVPFN